MVESRDRDEHVPVYVYSVSNPSSLSIIYALTLSHGYRVPGLHPIEHSRLMKFHLRQKLWQERGESLNPPTAKEMDALSGNMVGKSKLLISIACDR